MVKRHGFGKNERIRKPSEFKRVLAAGRRIKTQHFVFFAHRKGTGTKRIGISVSRRVGGAVVRNRIKRLVREVFRVEKENLPEGLDIVVIVKGTGGIRSRADVEKEFERAFRKING